MLYVLLVTGSTLLVSHGTQVASLEGIVLYVFTGQFVHTPLIGNDGIDWPAAHSQVLLPARVTRFLGQT